MHQTNPSLFHVSGRCYLHDDVVDGDVDEFDEEADEAHDGKPDRCGHGNFLELWRRENKNLGLIQKYHCTLLMLF